MLLALPLLVALAHGDSVPGASPATETASSAAVSFVVHRQPAIPLVSLRLALLVDDPPGYAGAGHLFQHLALPALRQQAARVGATVEMNRSSDAIVYTVTGPAAELDYLADVLRGALRPARHADPAVLGANRALAEERLAEWETAAQHVRSALRARLFPNDLSAAGTESSAKRITAELLPALWARLYRPERISIVAVGDVRLADVENAFRELPPAPPTRALEAREDTISLVPLAPAEATRAWLGSGYLANDLDPAALSIAARLLRDDLRRRVSGAEVETEHWWTHYGQALVVVVSVPERTVPAARRALSTAVSALRTDVTPQQVRGAARALRREMLFYSRTPDRMAEVLGRFTDRDGDPDAAQAFYASLDRVEPERVQEALQYLMDRSPARVEIPPQKLMTRP